MDTATMQVFTSLLTFLAGLGALASLAVVLLAPRWAPAGVAARVVGETGLWLAFVVAAGATLGSLWFSEVAGFVPCRLCWFQRIAMYPLAVVTLVAAIRGDRRVGWYVVPIAVLGAGVALWHYAIEWRPALEGGACSAAGPSCAAVWFREFGFVTLAFMALVGFLSIIVFTTLAARHRQGTESS
ncbi:MAG: disulfide bond formation protein B [Ilumatobacteraceae bacterium]